MQAFYRSKWIWLSADSQPDSYAQFTSSFTYGGGKASVNLSVDSDYALLINGAFVASNQYGDYEHYKIYDSINLTEYLHEGENELTFTVYHCGISNSRYRPYEAGLIFEVIEDGKITCVSSEETKSRPHPHYESGHKLFVTSQLGFTVFYDARGEGEEFAPSRVVDKKCQFFPRPIKKAALLPAATPSSVTKLSDTDYLIDLGGEVVGLPCLDFDTEDEQTVLYAWGEVLVDGRVRKTVGDRTFTLTYKAKRGENKFTEYMLRAGCRYVEIFTEKPITLRYAGVIPQVYEVDEAAVCIESPSDRAIYDACVKTLRCSMMEHYVDCPWREQALYACDSRNQMLCGYYAFEGGNLDYAKASLTLMGEDSRSDGMLSICFPCGIPLAIPSFSLHYIFAMRDYLDHSGDSAFILKYMPKMTAIVDEMLANRRGGLVQKFGGKDMWNFYEWTKHSDGTLWSAEAVRSDLAINCLTVMAIDCIEYLAAAVGAIFPYAGIADELRTSIKRAFFVDNAFVMHENTREFTALGNSLAILARVTVGDEAKEICSRIAKGEFVQCSISMKLLSYSAMLSVDPDYKAFILDEIRRTYSMMLASGHDTVWETVDGWRDFHEAGSLCHGWSAIPVYFFHKFGIAKKI